MLTGHGHAVTKVLSLTPDRSAILPNTLNSSTGSAQISAPLYAGARADQTTPQRSPIGRGFGKESPMSSANKSSRGLFKMGRRQGIVASEYDPELEFETRTASESSESTVEAGVPGTPTRSKRTHGRRTSKDDAWVDILVADHNRRIPGQEGAIPRVKSYDGRKKDIDPDTAREQIQKALDYSQHFDDAPEAMADPVGFHDTDDDVPPTPPAILVQPPTAVQPRIAPLPKPRDYRDSEYSEYSINDKGPSDFEPVHSRNPTHDIEFPRYSDEEGGNDRHSPSPPSPDDIYNHASASSTNRDAGILEFYQERRANGSENGNENGQSNGASNGNGKEPSEPKPSRLPVWTGSQPQSTSSSSSSLLSPPEHSLPQSDSDEPDAEPDLTQGGRVSPGRYVHGAPLHNVTEEEEEHN